jgi:hypothetical protein
MGGDISQNEPLRIRAFAAELRRKLDIRGKVAYVPLWQADTLNIRFRRDFGQEIARLRPP